MPPNARLYRQSKDRQAALGDSSHLPKTDKKAYVAGKQFRHTFPDLPSLWSRVALSNAAAKSEITEQRHNIGFRWKLSLWRAILGTALGERLVYRGDFALGTLMRFLPL